MIYDDLTEEALLALRGDDLEEEEAPEDEEAPEEEEEDTPEEDPRITRLLEQAEASKERNAWLEDQLTKLIDQGKTKVTAPEEPKEVYDFSAKEEEYISLIIEGEIAKASKLRSQIDSAKTSELLAAIRGETKASAAESIAEAKSLIEGEKFSKAVEVLEEKYPFFNPDHKSYNAEAVDTANSLMNGFIAKGDSRTEALKKAVARITPFYGTTIESKKGLGNERTGKAGKIAADAASRQPPKTSGIKTSGASPTAKSLSQYTDKEFAKLTSAELRELRGDM